LCSKLGIEGPEAYSLYMEVPSKSQTVDIAWLQASGTLLEQNVTEETVLGFTKTPAAEMPIDASDTELVASLYEQVKPMV
jgi:hypothetical protein